MNDDTTGNRARREAVAKALLREMERGGGGWNVRNMAAAAIAAAIPPGYVVVSRDDLLNALQDWDDAGHSAPGSIFTENGDRPWWGDREQEIHDRLQAALEEQG